MKKILILSLLTFVAFAVQAQKKPKVALVSVYVDKNLTGANGFTASALEDLSQKYDKGDPTQEFVDIATIFKQNIIDKYAPEMPFDLMPEEEVINHPDYWSWDKSSNKKLGYRFEQAEKYILGDAPAAWADKANYAKMAKGLDVDAIMIAYIDFAQGTGVGIGPFAVNKLRANANFRFIGRDGERITTIREMAESNGTMEFLFGFDYDFNKGVELAGEATTNLHPYMEKNIGYNAKKITKKFIKAGLLSK